MVALAEAVCVSRPLHRMRPLHAVSAPPRADARLRRRGRSEKIALFPPDPADTRDDADFY